jgi:hypothetical protein
MFLLSISRGEVRSVRGYDIVIIRILEFRAGFLEIGMFLLLISDETFV